jgi:serine/threonine protein kinase
VPHIFVVHTLLSTLVVDPLHVVLYLQVGTLEYMAPEVLLKEPTSLASDVYAFAVTINELATAVVPFSDCTKVRYHTIGCTTYQRGKKDTWT